MPPSAPRFLAGAAMAIAMAIVTATATNRVAKAADATTSTAASHGATNRRVGNRVANRARMNHRAMQHRGAMNPGVMSSRATRPHPQPAASPATRASADRVPGVHAVADGAVVAARIAKVASAWDRAKDRVRARTRARGSPPATGLITARSANPAWAGKRSTSHTNRLLRTTAAAGMRRR